MVDTSITRPALLEPPFKQPMLDASGIVSQIWQAWFTDISQGAVQHDDLRRHHDPAHAAANRDQHLRPAGRDLRHAGRRRSTIRTLEFQCDGAPTEPAAYFQASAVGALPLDVVTGTLQKVDETDAVVAVPDTDFNWYAVGL